MKTNSRFLPAAFLLALFASIFTARSEPRDILPPWPEYTLGIWGFNESFLPMMPSRIAVGADSAQVADSWSGHALVRDAFTLSPVAVPATDPFYRKRNFTTTEGTVRFWFRPEWSGVNAGGLGPRGFARLLELVTLTGKEPETVWSLYFNPEGDMIYLSGMGVGGATDFLRAEVKMTANRWHLISLSYDEKQTILMVDAAVVATGSAFPPVASWKAEGLGLVIGSDITGANPAQGWLDEVCTFDSVQSAEDAMWYRNSLRWTVILGAVGTAKEEAVKQRWLEQLKFEEYGEPEVTPTIAYRSRPEEYPTNALWLDISGVTNSVVTMRLQGTVPDTLYEILSQENFMTNVGWQSEGVWVGTEGQDWTDTPVLVGPRTNQLFLRARSWKDEDGNGIPDWWEMQEFGATGVDGYADPDGDGWVNIQEYQNGTGPNGFNTPAAPQGLTVKLGSGGSTASLTWQPVGGPVTSYTIERSLQDGWPNTFYNVSSSTVTFTDTTGELPTGFYSYGAPVYRVQANYASGLSAFSGWTMAIESLAPQATTMSYAGSQYATVVTTVPPTASGLRLEYWYYSGVNPPVSVGQWDMPVSSLANNVAVWPTNANAPYGFAYVSWISSNNAVSRAEIQYLPWAAQFWDGRVQLKQNLIFLLRAAPLDSSFGFFGFDTPEEYAFVGLRYLFTFPNDVDPPLDESLPFGENYLYRNFAFNATNLYDNGWLTTGADWVNSAARLYSPVLYSFDQFVPGTPVTPLLGVSEARWLFWTGFYPGAIGGPWEDVGITISGTNWQMATGYWNWFGLPYVSAKLAWGSNATEMATLNVGGSIGINDGVFYPETAQPVLTPAGFYFGRAAIDWLPGHTDFSPTNQTPVMFAGVGTSLDVAGYAKYAIANGYTNKFAYLGQYLDKAYKANTNGTRSTNETGILSPYGEFFATEPGKTFLTTKADGVSTNIGECVVNVIKLQLDVNHDGVMNTSWAGPDNTSSEKPFVFWVNNDFDRGHNVDCIPGPCDSEEDDVSMTDSAAGSPGFNMASVSDADYPSGGSVLFIPCKRDLEDYTRLWIPGLAALYTANTNLIFELSVRNGDASDGPAINLFHAIEVDGGTNYLWDDTIAGLQVASSSGIYPARVSPSAPLHLNTMFWIGGASDHFIFCGARRGKGELVLRISDSQSNLLAETSSWVQFKDVKEMYERWTVGDNGSKPPTNTAYRAVEDLPTGATAFAYDPPTGTNTPYILHVHGWNMERWEKDRFGEAMFKRLYWQGYQGRFGIFRWPTGTGLTSYDSSEFNAWKSGAPLRKLLLQLSTNHPGQVRLTAHSMGNVVAGEALRTNTPLVHTYVAMQAAVPAHAYDPTTTNRSLGLFDSGTPNRYAQYWTNGASCYFSAAAGAARYVNFFNEDDWALDLWKATQNTKPDLGYSFLNGVFQHHPTVLTFPQDTFELFSFCVEARCYALGAQGNVGGQFLVAQDYQQLDLKAIPYSFGEAHKGHSAQFRSTNMKRAPFWDTFLKRTQLKD